MRTLHGYEHLIPEKLWTDAQHPGEGVSAVKALARAAAGQKIYTLTARNADALAQVQVDDAARAEIQDALAAGKVVTVHESPVTISGWTGTGSGYVVADPDTGAGAYTISGGANGGFLTIMGGSLASFGVLGIIYTKRGPQKAHKKGSHTKRGPQKGVRSCIDTLLCSRISFRHGKTTPH
jgi:hypothetical protein